MIPVIYIYILVIQRLQKCNYDRSNIFVVQIISQWVNINRFTFILI